MAVVHARLHVHEVYRDYNLKSSLKSMQVIHIMSWRWIDYSR